MAQLGIVTYNIARTWDLPTIISRLEKLGYEGVELRTTHAHKVEVNLTKAERDEVRKRFEDSPVQLAGLGSAFEYHSADPAEVRRNIDGTKEYVRLAHDVGSPGVKVRPNGVPRGADLDATLRQIGRALHEVGDDAEDFGVAIRVEVHGSVTSNVENFARIMKYADHPNVYACWNSNPSDVKNGSINENFALVASKVHEVHLRDLTDEAYPWREPLRALEGPELRGLHAGGDPRKPGSGAGAAVLSVTLAGVSATAMTAPQKRGT